MTESSAFPRVLILCDEPVNQVGGGGVTMRNLFRAWPADRLAQIWAHHRFEIDTGVCPQNLRLGAHTMPGHRWVPERIRQKRTLVARLRPVLRPGLRLDYLSVRSWAVGFGPDVIYSQATPFPMYTWWLPRWLARDLDVPLVNHIMDDWPAALAADWPPPLRRLLSAFTRRQLGLLFGSAARNLAISGEMATAFSERYGREFVPFHNVIDLDEWAWPKTNYSGGGDGFRVVYLGALATNMQLASLQDVGVAVSRLHDRGEKVHLTIYAGELYRSHFEQYLGDLPAVSFGGAVPRTELCRRLAEADLLVVPVNFDPASLALNQYSMPTKVPEYMASGTPILVYAPSHTPPAAYARQAGWGLVVDRQDQAALSSAILRLMDSAELRSSLGRRGRELALRNHDAATKRVEFRETLADVVVGG